MRKILSNCGKFSHIVNAISRCTESFMKMQRIVEREKLTDIYNQI